MIEMIAVQLYDESWIFDCGKISRHDREYHQRTSLVHVSKIGGKR
jgi:hypothetical protein